MREQLDERGARVAARTGAPLGHVLVSSGVLDGRRLARFLSQRLQLDLAALGEGEIHPRVLSLVPAALARKARALPVALQRRPAGDFLVVAVSDPTDRACMDEVEAAARLPVLPVLVEDGDLSRAIARFYGEEATTDPGLQQLPQLEPVSAEVPVVVGAVLEEPPSPPSWTHGPRWLTESTEDYLGDLGLKRALQGLAADTEDLDWLRARFVAAATEPGGTGEAKMPALDAARRGPSLPEPKVGQSREFDRAHVDAATTGKTRPLDPHLLDLTVADGGLSARAACAVTSNPHLAWLAGDLAANLRSMHFVDEAKAAVELCRRKGDIDLVLLLDPARDGPTLEALLEMDELKPRPTLVVLSADSAFERISAVDLRAAVPATADALRQTLGAFLGTVEEG